jgi:ubiquinone/menaquinone biosynthesis C-methylase UbiE
LPNVERFAGLGETYDRFRPCPPDALADVLLRIGSLSRPHTVVDLGSGTGLSTRLWVGRAERIIGVEPNEEMRQEAERRNPDEASQARFVAGTSSHTSLLDSCADLVTIAQAFHWMEPEPTLAEVDRLLKPGGILAVYDYDAVPTMGWEAERTLSEFMDHTGALDRDHNVGVQRWPKTGHLENLQKSGYFRYVKELLVHSMEEGDAERLVGYALSHGSVGSLLRQGMSETELGLDRLRHEAARILENKTILWYFSYRVRVGVK